MRICVFQYELAWLTNKSIYGSFICCFKQSVPCRFNIIVCISGCDASSTNPNFQCPRHKHEISATPQTTNLPLALKSLPPEVGLCASSVPETGYGICAKRTIPVGAWIGPYEGKFVKPEALSSATDTSYMWEVCK